MSAVKFFVAFLALTTSPALATNCFPVFNFCVDDTLDSDEINLRSLVKRKSPEIKPVDEEQPLSSVISINSSSTSPADELELWEDDELSDDIADIFSDVKTKRVRWAPDVKIKNGPTKGLRRIKIATHNRKMAKARYDMAVYNEIRRRVGKNTAKKEFQNKSSAQIMAQLLIKNVISNEEMYRLIRSRVDLAESPYW